MKKTLLKLFSVYFIISVLAISTQISAIVSAQAVVVDYPTVQCVSFSNDLIYGSNDQNTGNQVTLLQVFLTQKGYEIGRDSFGTFGYGTKDAVALFQATNNLIPTGFVGLNTRELIKNLSCDKTNSYSNLPSSRVISNIPSNICGSNNGLIWNGQQCLKTCDQNHPWNPNAQRCSLPNDNYYEANSNNLNQQNFPIVSQTPRNYDNNICAVYAPDYIWNGSYCVQPNNYNYCGNDNNIYWNGFSCVKKNITQYLCVTNGKYYTNKINCPIEKNLNNDYRNVYLNSRVNHSVNSRNYNYENLDFYSSDSSYYLEDYSIDDSGEGTVNSGYYDIYGNYHSL